MAPTIAGTSKLCICEDYLVNSIANSATFQSMIDLGGLGLGGYDERVFIDELPRRADETDDEYTVSEFNDLFPCAIISEAVEGGVTFSHTSDGGPYGYSHSIFLNVEIQKQRGALNNEDEHRTFKDQCLNILEEVLEQTGTALRFSPTTARNSRIEWLQPETQTGIQRLAMMLFFEVITDA